MTADTTERGLERILCNALTGTHYDPIRDNTLTEIPPTRKQVTFDELAKNRSSLWRRWLAVRCSEWLRYIMPGGQADCTLMF